MIADVQYALAASGWDFHRTQERHYRFSRVCMQGAIGEFAKAGVTCVLQLGDLLDGQCKKTDPRAVATDVLADWKKMGSTPVLHALGNHELYCFSKEEAAALFGVAKEWRYTFSPHPGWKVIVCDSYGLTTLDSRTEKDAFAFLSNHNPNDVRSMQVDWVAGLQGTQRRFVPYNGGFGEEQRQWLARELDCDERVIIATHIPIAQESCSDACLLWDFEEVRQVLAKGRAKVVAVFAGHDHDGGYKFDEELRIHHITMPSPMVCKNKGVSAAHSIVYVHDDHLEVQGFGTARSMKIEF